MNPTHITLTAPNGASRTFDIAFLERAALEIAGGGISVEQTAKAMEIGRQVREGKTVEHRGWSIQPQAAEDILKTV